jgi:thiamine transporter ThiT
VGHSPASAAPRIPTAMIVDLMKFFGDIFIPSLVTAHSAPVGWRAKIYRLVDNATTTIFMPLISIAAGYQ